MAKRDKKWLHRQERDPYVKQARDSHYRSRAIYKLMEIDKRDRLFGKTDMVVDVGSSPGSWSQYAAEQSPAKGRIVAVDILPMKPVDRVEFVQGDFTEEKTILACQQLLAGSKAGLVMSDIAPNLTGVRMTDQARMIHMAELVLDFSGEVLNEGGDLLIKLFQGEGTEQYQKELKQLFQKVIVRKPKASRAESRELYVLARGYKV